MDRRRRRSRLARRRADRHGWRDGRGSLLNLWLRFDRKRCRLLHRWRRLGNGGLHGSRRRIHARGSRRRVHQRRRRRKHHRDTRFRRWRGQCNALQQADDCQQRQAMRQDRHGERDVSSPDHAIRRGQRQTCDAFSRGRPSGHRHTLVSAVRKAQAIRTAPATASARGAGAVWAVAAPTADRRDTHDRSRCGRAGHPARSRWRRNATR